MSGVAAESGWTLHELFGAAQLGVVVLGNGVVVDFVGSVVDFVVVETVADFVVVEDAVDFEFVASVVGVADKLVVVGRFEIPATSSRILGWD